MTRSGHRTQSGRGLLSDPTEELQNHQDDSHSIPQPPPNWPLNGGHNSQPMNHSVSTDDNEDSDDSTDEFVQQTRGPTLMRSGWGNDGGILEIAVNELNQPIGDTAAKLYSHLGVIARNGILAPLNYKDWRLVPKLYKDQIWNHIKENTNATNDKRRILMMSVGKKWKEWKHEAKAIGYDPYETNAERLAHRPDRVDETQWRALVYYWNSEEAKNKSDKNKLSRAKVTMPHTTGRKSHPQIRNELTRAKGGIQPTRLEMFKFTRTKKDKTPINNEAAEMFTKLDQVAAEHPESNVPGYAYDDAFAQAYGIDGNGRVRTLGIGAAPGRIFGPTFKRSEADQREFDARVQEEVDKFKISMQDEIRVQVQDVIVEKVESVRKEIEATLETRVQVEVDARLQVEINARLQAMGLPLHSSCQMRSTTKQGNDSYAPIFPSSSREAHQSKKLKKK